MKKREAMIALRDAQLKKGHLLNTRKTYLHWLCRYIDGAASGRFSDLQEFLDHLVIVDQLNPKTVRQALNAMVFFYKSVLDRDPGQLRVPKVNRHRNHPNFLNRGEIVELLSRMSGKARLQAELLIGTGSRINAMLTLRLKDIDLDKRTVCFRFDKGGKTRTVKLPDAIVPRLTEHVERVKRQWEKDHSDGIIAPAPEPSLARKLGRNVFGTLPWYWLFPSQVVRDGCRWHATDRGLAKAISIAAADAKIMKRVTPHTLRHTNATALLDMGVNVRRIQEHLGHSNLATTEIYLHTTGTDALPSPIDQLPAIIPFAPTRHQATA